MDLAHIQLFVLLALLVVLYSLVLVHFFYPLQREIIRPQFWCDELVNLVRLHQRIVQLGFFALQEVL